MNDYIDDDMHANNKTFYLDKYEQSRRFLAR